MHGLAGRMALEIIQRQAQQAREDVQIQLGIQPRAHGQHNQPPGVAEQGFIDHPDRQNDGQQGQRRIAVMGQHPVHRRHDQQRRKNRQEAERQGGIGDIAQRLPLLPDQGNQPAAGERRIRFRDAAIGADQHGLASPDLSQPHFIHYDGGFADRRQRVLDHDNASFGVCRGHQPSAAVVQQQDDGTRRLKPQQLPPVQPDPLGPHAAFLRPGGQRSGRRGGLARLPAEIAFVQLHPIITRGERHGTDTRINPLLARAEAGIGRLSLIPAPTSAGGQGIALITVHKRLLCGYCTGPYHACPALCHGYLCVTAIRSNRSQSSPCFIIPVFARRKPVPPAHAQGAFATRRDIGSLYAYYAKTMNKRLNMS